MNKIQILLAVWVLGFVAAHALTGFDISKFDCEGGFSSYSLWNCFANEGYGFTVIEAINGGLGMTQTISSCVAGASNAGLYVSLYGWSVLDASSLSSMNNQFLRGSSSSTHPHFCLFF